jgi:hypothetical protein
MHPDKPATSAHTVHFVLFGVLGDLAWRLMVPAP